MNADSLCVECTLHNDPRLLSGIGAVIAHAVRLAGIPDQDQDRIASALAEACEKALRGASGSEAAAGEIKVSAADYPDRVEVKVDSLTRGGADADSSGKKTSGYLSGDSLNRDGDGFGTTLGDAVADRVKCEMQDGYLRLTLTKCKGVAKAGANS
jgi:anti-sigma regulatory factor (Ser/Thr protein kinase)